MKYDAVVVGSGPNGLAAAICLQQEGLQVLLIEGHDIAGGGMRTAELTLPGFRHDVCSSIYPMAVTSPFFRELPLHKHGLEWINPRVVVAHPFDDGTAAIMRQDVQATADRLGEDADAYEYLMADLVKQWPRLADAVMKPFQHLLRNKLLATQFGLVGLQPMTTLLHNRFKGRDAKALLAGIGAHSMMPLRKWGTTATGMMLALAGHVGGWPIAKGGAQAIADALISYYKSIGGTLETGKWVRSLRDLPPSRLTLLDLTPRQLLEVAGDQLSWLYRKQLSSFEYGQGVFKVDFALSGPIPWTAPECHDTLTVHLGGTLEEIEESEEAMHQGRHHPRPYVLMAQPSLLDPTRAPEGKHTVWAYCHVPKGSIVDMTEAIEKQIERFAPGFRKLIMARHTFNSRQYQQYNPNYIGGDINGGAQKLSQLFTRPALRIPPYATSHKGLYICSSSTPPGGGVHGMCGYNAAEHALRTL